jgi:hypothetical protein
MMAPSERNKAKEESIPEVTRCGALVVRNESRAVGNVEDFVHFITPEDIKKQANEVVRTKFQ